MSDSLQPNGLYSPRNSLGQNTGVGSRSLLQGISPTRPGIEPRSPTLQMDSLPTEPWNIRPQTQKVKKKKEKKSQGNTAQMKEQSRNRQVQINEDDIGKLPEKEFRIMIIKMIQNFKARMEKVQEPINKDYKE